MGESLQKPAEREKGMNAKHDRLIDLMIIVIVLIVIFLSVVSIAYAGGGWERFCKTPPVITPWDGGYRVQCPAGGEVYPAPVYSPGGDYPYPAPTIIPRY